MYELCLAKDQGEKKVTLQLSFYLRYVPYLYIYIYMHSLFFIFVENAGQVSEVLNKHHHGMSKGISY